MQTFVDLGLGCYVRADDVVAVHDGYVDTLQFITQMQFTHTAGQPTHPKAALVLRGGGLLPAYVSAHEVVRRLNSTERYNVSELRAHDEFSARLLDRLVDGLYDLKRQVHNLRVQVRNVARLLPGSDETAEAESKP